MLVPFLCVEESKRLTGCQGKAQREPPRSEKTPNRPTGCKGKAQATSQGKEQSDGKAGEQGSPEAKAHKENESDPFFKSASPFRVSPRLGVSA